MSDSAPTLVSMRGSADRKFSSERMSAMMRRHPSRDDAAANDL